MRAMESLVQRLSLFLVLAGLPTPARAQHCDWSALDIGMNNNVRALTVFDDGSGSALYAGAPSLQPGAWMPPVSPSGTVRAGHPSEGD